MTRPGLNGKANGKAVGADDALGDLQEVPPFGFHEEEAIVSLILDMPEFFATFAHLIKPELFTRMETRYVVAWLMNAYEKHGIVLTRPLLRDQVARQLTIDEPYQEILSIIDRKSNPREVPVIRDRLKEWARNKALGLLYDEETVAAYQRGDYERLEEIFNMAGRINDTTYRGFWFFDEFEQLLDPENTIHYKTGFKRLDLALNNGGPSPGEVIVWLAATNVGKCHTLDSKIIESNLSRVFVLEMEDGTSIELVGYREVQTQRGVVKVCDLSEGDDVVAVLDMERPAGESLPSV